MAFGYMLSVCPKFLYSGGMAILWSSFIIYAAWCDSNCLLNDTINKVLFMFTMSMVQPTYLEGIHNTCMYILYIPHQPWEKTPFIYKLEWCGYTLYTMVQPTSFHMYMYICMQKMVCYTVLYWSLRVIKFNLTLWVLECKFSVQFNQSYC